MAMIEQDETGCVAELSLYMLNKVTDIHLHAGRAIPNMRAQSPGSVSKDLRPDAAQRVFPQPSSI